MVDIYLIALSPTTKERGRMSTSLFQRQRIREICISARQESGRARRHQIRPHIRTNHLDWSRRAGVPSLPCLQKNDGIAAGADASRADFPQNPGILKTFADFRPVFSHIFALRQTDFRRIKMLGTAIFVKLPRRFKKRSIKPIAAAASVS